MANSSIYTLGGTVQADGGVYIPRHADEELLGLCRQSVFTYILTSRQMGKSSLMVRTAQRLADEDIQSVIIDLTQLGVKLTAQQWYLGLISIIEEALMLDTDALEWWHSRNHLGFTQRLTQFFQEVLLVEVTSSVVIFVDEIDTTLSLDFTDDFFAAIRYLYVARAQNVNLQRLSFVLIGVATPGDLIRDPKRTPFNIGQRLDLTDFTFEEARPLAEGLGVLGEPGQKLLKWILKWTGGHPYLTQRLCSVISQENKHSWSAAAVKQVVGSTFFGAMSQQDNNLQFVRDMLTKRAPNQDEVLNVYRQIRLDRGSVADEEQSIIKSHLKLSGVVRRESNILRLRNRIYGQVFDRKWINENLPFSLRDRWDQLKPAIPYVVVLSVIAVLMGGLALYAREQSLMAQQQTKIAQQRLHEAEEARKKETEQRKIAQKQEREAKAAKQAEAKQLKIAQERGVKLTAALKQEAEQRKVAEERKIQAENAQKLAQQREAQAKDALQTTKVAQQAEAEQRKVAEERKIQAENAQKLAERRQAEAEQQKALALKRQGNAEILAQTLNAENQLASNLGIEALVAGLKAGKKVKQHNKNVEADNRVKAITTLQQLVYGVREQNRLESHSGSVLSVAFSPDGKTIATASYDKTVKLWNTQGKEIKTLPSDDNKVKLWNSQGVVIKTLKNHSGDVNSVTFSPDGKTIASASRDNMVKLWNSQGVVIKTLPSERSANKGHRGDVNSVAFSPDGKTIATASDDKTVKLWNSQGVVIKTLKGHSGAVTSVAFSPMSAASPKEFSKMMISASADRTVKLWNFDLDDLLTKVCDRIGDYLNNNPYVSKENRGLCDGISVKK